MADYSVSRLGMFTSTTLLAYKKNQIITMAKALNARILHKWCKACFFMPGPSGAAMLHHNGMYP